MDANRDAPKSAIRKILLGPFRRGVARKPDVSKGTPSSTSDEIVTKETKDEKIFSHSVAKILKKSIAGICTSRKLVGANFNEEPKNGMDFMDPAVNIEPTPTIRPEAIVTISPMISPILVQGVFVPSPTLVHINDADISPLASELSNKQDDTGVHVTGGTTGVLTGTKPNSPTVEDTESFSDYGSGSTASEQLTGSKDMNMSDIPEIIVDNETSLDRYSEIFGDHSVGLETSMSNERTSTVKLTPRAFEKHARRYARFKDFVPHMPELDNSVSAPSLLLSPAASTSGSSTPALETPVFEGSHGAGALFDYSELIDEELADHLSNVKDDSRRYGIYHKEEFVGGVFQRR